MNVIAGGINGKPIAQVFSGHIIGNVSLPPVNNLPMRVVPEYLSIGQVPFYPIGNDYRKAVNQMARIYKDVIRSMPNQLAAGYVNPNPTRINMALPGPQIGMVAVVESGEYRGFDNG